MSERKVLNKYIKPDHDYKKINNKKPRGRGGNKKVRLMAPFSMQCTTCGDYIYKGKKFNARKENADGEEYLGIQILRFYIRCPLCAAEITFKTDPQNTDYVAERGAQRNFEPWREIGDLNDEIQKEKEEEEENNPMKALENRTREAKREMDILDGLDEIRTKNAIGERVDAATLLNRLHSSNKNYISEKMRIELDEDDELAKSYFHDADGDAVKRIDDEELTLDGFVRAQKEEEEFDFVQQTSSSKPDFDFIKPRTVPRVSTVSIKRKADASLVSLVVKKDSGKGKNSLGMLVKNTDVCCEHPKTLNVLGNMYGDSGSESD